MYETDPDVLPFPKYLILYLFGSFLAAGARFRPWKIFWPKLVIFATRRLHEASLVKQARRCSYLTCGGWEGREGVWACFDDFSDDTLFDSASKIPVAIL